MMFVSYFGRLSDSRTGFVDSCFQPKIKCFRFLEFYIESIETTQLNFDISVSSGEH